MPANLATHLGAVTSTGPTCRQQLCVVQARPARSAMSRMLGTSMSQARNGIASVCSQHPPVAPVPPCRPRSAAAAVPCATSGPIGANDFSGGSVRHCRAAVACAAAAEQAAPSSSSPPAATSLAPGDPESRAFAVAMAKIADETKCQDIVVLDVAPVRRPGLSEGC